MRRRTGYLLKRGKVYYACWHVGKKLHMKTTGKRNRDEATVELNRIMEPFVVGDEIQVLQNIKAKIEGQSEHLTELEDAANPPLAVADAWLAYDRAGNRKEITDGTMRNYDCYWTAFTRWLAKSHPEATRLREITFPICEEYKEHLTAAKVTGRTFNAHRAFLRTFFNILADKARLTDGNPWAKLAKRDEHPMGRRPLTVEELRRVCRAAEGELRIMLAFGLYLGARLGDAACMNWGSVDMARRLIRYTPRKTARKNPEALLIPMHPELFAILDETPTAKRKGPVTPDMARRYTEKGQGPVSALVQKHFERCGITTTDERPGAGVRRRVAVGFHSLRHTAVSLLRQAGAAQSISQALVGHNSPEVHELYTHQDEDALRRAVHALPAVIEDKPPEPSRDEKLIALLRGLTAKNARKVKVEALKLMGIQATRTSKGEGKP